MSLLRTARRAAIASAVHGRVQRRQHERWAAADQTAAAPSAPPAPAPAPPPAPVPSSEPMATDELLAQLERLAKLRDSGVLTEAEFAQQKARLLG